jgi:hypothetical protein
VWETLAHKPEFYRVCWKEMELPGNFRSDVSEPTASKWEVVEDCYGWLLTLIEHGLVEFAAKMRCLFRGSMTPPPPPPLSHCCTQVLKVPSGLKRGRRRGRRRQRCSRTRLYKTVTRKTGTGLQPDSGAWS